MSVEIMEVRSNKGLKRFVNFPYSLYQGSPYWIPPLFFDEIKNLRQKSNPAFKFCDVKFWLAYKDGKICGRIAGIINHRFIEKWKTRTARFGWIDFTDDIEVSSMLLKTVEDWAKSCGMEGIQGPMGFTDFDPEGMLVEGFEELGTMAAIYNYPYYPVHLERLGYSKAVDWVEFAVVLDDKIEPRVSRIASAVMERYGLSILELKKTKDILPYAKEMFALLNKVYDGLYGVVSLTDEQIDAAIESYFSFIKPDFVPIVMDREGRIAGFGIVMPSLSRALQRSKGRLLPFGFIHLLKAIHKNDSLDLLLVGVRPDMQKKGVNAVLMDQINKTCVKRGFRFVETNYELETNSDVQGQWKFYNSRQHKKRRCFQKDI